MGYLITPWETNRKMLGFSQNLYTLVFSYKEILRDETTQEKIIFFKEEMDK